ncbi:calcium-translocating P-type ATPase, PMCA-type [Aminipila luticellarii]|uniref:P-type Ca(2+) transporter n=1 Tax=Aminipila luticellarii TaxID=2507160 RepID=A0A410PSJ1_9FIRM|nr:calcium-translocating P-type ATPase, PMCA-type [Aminipila luticellarii]QAT41883.1 calcium-translocating P-type ATPase, PMCA-type [Aminipila luticellarii]
MLLNSGNVTLDSLVGLTEEETALSRDKHGSNQLGQRKKNQFMKQFIQNFNDPIIKILLIALAVNVVLLLHNFNWYESAGIAIAIFLATFVSTLSEYGSESAFEKLQEEADATFCRVKRAAGLLELPVNDVVTGDYVLLQAGEKIPADGLILSGELYVDQSALNGEAKEVLKIPQGSSSSASNQSAVDFMQPNKLFRGSVVCSGEGIMQITSVGLHTFYGHIAHEVQDETRDSPLKHRLKNLAELISTFGYAAAAVVAIADLFNSLILDQGYNMSRTLEVIQTPSAIVPALLHALTLAITVIVVAVPEGLPMMITVVLSSNMKKMLKDNVLVRKLVGIETSGSLNILFSDKTGTITKGKLQVVSFISGKNTEYNPSQIVNKRELYSLLELSSVYNTTAALSLKKGHKTVIGGNSTERALLEFSMEHSVIDPRNIKVLSKLPFNSTNKYSAVTIANKGVPLTLIKGAPEKILPKCTKYYDEYGHTQHSVNLSALNQTLSQLSSKAIRLLAVAASDSPENSGDGFHDLTLIGIFGIRDEIRPEAVSAIRQVTKAGIQVVMITGDNKDTASAIAREAHLIREGEPSAVMTSSELSLMSDDMLKRALPQLRVVARALPSDKSRLIKVSQEMGLVAGMTGDGVNDAPALKKADVGFSMGSGTEIAKEASDIVILDDNFQSIAKAILYGRTIFKSIRKFIVFQLTVNLCAVIVSIVGPFLGVDTPVTVIQMLWINMVMDTLAGLAFSGEIPLEEYMKEPPKRRDEVIINKYMWNQILFTGTYTSVLCLLFLKLPVFHRLFRGYEGMSYFMTAFFSLFIFASIFNSFNARTYRLNLLAHLKGNKAFIAIISLICVVQLLLIYFGGSVFRTAGLTFWELQMVLLLAFSVVPVDMIRKVIIRMNGRKGYL